MTTWLQTTVPFAHDPEKLQDGLYISSLMEAATTGLDPNVALLCRDVDYKVTHLLLTPAAAKYADRLSGEWVPVDPTPHGWAVLYSAGVTVADLGLRDPD